ncbi:hypothetical protein LSH36_360g00003 [Paralvinella palmiformis]|uniref:G-protein coupled receptors family 1 profile domain-containing protein n=1 Tax=Paralvinella palmiformis TaxID=53620 RepID=A0AAD9JG50_9ANNE|nr:hypothetical protein LSH36_360g00003 [Paralvinella palmiformis]
MHLEVIIDKVNKTLMFFDVDILELMSFFNSSLESSSSSTDNQTGTTFNGSYRDLNEIVEALIYFSHFRFYFVPINAALGIVGNVFTAVTLWSTALSVHPTLHFVIAKCVADSLFLASLFVQWLRMIGYDLYDSGVWCHILAMVTHATNFLSTWFVTCLAVDRFIIVYITGSEKPVCRILKSCPCGLFTARPSIKPGGQLTVPGWTVLKTTVAIIGLSLLSVAVYLNISLTLGVTERSHRKICVPLPMYSSVMQILGEIDIFINVILPYALDVTLTFITCRRVLLFHAARKRTITKREFSRQHYQFYSKSQLRLTIMTAGVCLCFLLLTGPSQTLRFQYTIREMLNTHHRLTIYEYFWQHVFLMVYFSAFSSNFIVIVIFHKGFRKAIELFFVDISFKMRTWYGRRQTNNMDLSPMTFAVDFSSTLVRLNETSLG